MPQSKGKGYRLSAPVLNDRMGLLRFTSQDLSQATGIPVKMLYLLKAGRARFKEISKAQRAALRVVLQLSTEYPDLDCNELHPPRMDAAAVDLFMAEITMKIFQAIAPDLRKALGHQCD